VTTSDSPINAQIAAELTLTPETVANHPEQIRNKPDSSNRARIAVWATEQGLYHGA
jgi:DNA-binding CsgD family transcriptional regulator